MLEIMSALCSYISLTVEVSLDGRQWEDCCGDRTSFYLDDKKEETGVIQTNSFHDLIPARYVRIRVSTGLRWVGHDDKCFRFEILGCSPTSEARSELRAEASTHGYLSVSWASPNVSLAKEDSDTEDTLTLDSRYYSLAVTRDDSGEEVIYNTSDHSLIHPSPVYGAVYRLRLTCYYHHLAIPCGYLELEARPRVSLSCQAHSSFCDPDTELVVFRLPERLTASYLGNGSMLVEWVNTDTGWVAEVLNVRLKVTLKLKPICKHPSDFAPQDDRGVTILDQEIAANRYKMLLSGLAETGARQHGINFIPSGPGVPTDGGKQR